MAESRIEHPAAVTETLARVAEALADRPQLAALFANCYPNTLDTTTELHEDGSTYVFTGDIPAMWLRDSSAQVSHYVPLAAQDADVRRIISGVVRKQVGYILIDPYANAFNREPDGSCWEKDETEQNDWVWERKYEIDSLCWPLWLAHRYWKASGDASVFDADFRRAAVKILDLWTVEQDHRARSPYRFQRRDCRPSDTLSHEGLGPPVAPTGMTWSGFRPSDDACRYGYLVPSNLFAVVVLGHLGEIARAVWSDEAIMTRAEGLAAEIDAGVRAHAVIDDDRAGPVYAYEVDGLGGHHFMDDANVPSLLSLPYLSACAPDDELYGNTRRLILSERNPFYHEGRYAKGIGSPHTPEGYIWHISLSMQGLTAASVDEMNRLIDMLEATDGGTGYMHEGFLPDDPATFTREWFAWSNSLFAEFVLHWLRATGRYDGGGG
jgi:meiotically up-regulated gene 157 (Mug157) protein